VVGTDTLKGIFGYVESYATGGVEVWAASSSASAFTQVNVDGFGTLYPGCVYQKPPRKTFCNFPIHQAIGSYAVYQAPGQTSPSLYVGTKSHWGAEIWRWDGSTWSTANQPSVCLGCLGTSVIEQLRNESMVVFGGKLHVAEGYPQADLVEYDGSNWSTLEAGPNPFDASNNGLLSLATLNNKVYVATKRDGAATSGVQVWAGWLRRAPILCSDTDIPLPDLLYDPPKINFVVPESMLELRSRVVNVGQGPSDEGLSVVVRLDGGLVSEREIPSLGPGEGVDLEVRIQAGPGDHVLDLVADPEGRAEDAVRDNNGLHLTIASPQVR
jgi:hypothetical protein